MAKGLENNTSKLYYIKPCIEDWESAYNNCKIHIEHTRLTHRYLMSRNTKMGKCSMWKLELNNKTLPTKLPPMEGQQNEIQYSG